MASFLPLLRAAFMGALTLSLVMAVEAQSLGDFLKPGINLTDPAQRAEVVGLMLGVERSSRAAALDLAVRRGFSPRIVRRDGGVMELLRFEGATPVYVATHNVNAAVSSGAELVRMALPGLTGSGVTVGVWDGGAVRATHQEFGGRVTVLDGALPIDHATHVGGTIAAAGLVPSAKGMATAATIDSYEWTSDKSELTARAAAYPGEPGKLYLSNHSYGLVAGWSYTGLASPAWEWWGNGTTAAGIEQDFGRYDTNARDIDALAASAPYFLMFRSAGNDGQDNPGTGQPVSLTPGGTTAVAYDPALHPAGDSVYKNGYDSLGFEAAGKNLFTIGSVSDAVSGGARDAGAAFLSSFSSCGPTDDGRIKPDVVANGESLYSTFGGSDGSYSFSSGTSMSSPNAAGSAALLIQHFSRLFPGQAMRASSLKALIIHTADDRGVAGPDYRYGWGLINVKAAADLLSTYRTTPGTAGLQEGRLTTAAPARTHSFTWDGVSPIRATLVWTDPAGTATTTSESRTRRLVNNLDLKINAPGGTPFSPWVMPYVGDWTDAKLAAAAVPGKNNTDNVEQVFIGAPASAGIYDAVVSVDGSLTNGQQTYSLVISGSSVLPAPPPPLVTAVSPAAGSGGTVILTLSGGNFPIGATVRLNRSGEPDIAVTNLESLGDTLKGRADLTGRANGAWHVTVTNPDGQSAVLTNGFSIIGPLWQADLEDGAAGWNHGNSQGSTDNWALSSNRSRSVTHSFFAAGPSSVNINDLESPAIPIPVGMTNLNLTFWHNYTFQTGRDGGVLEFSVDGGAWFDVTASGSGAAFATGGYNSTFINSGSTSSRNPLAPRAAWTGAITGFTQVMVNLTDSAKYAGHALRIRWRLATNNSTSSAGWYIDDISLNGGAAPVNLPPVLTDGPVSQPSTAPVTSAVLSLTATDDAGEAALIYTWAAAGGGFPSTVAFSENGTHAARTTTVTFHAAGSYTFTCTVRDAEGLTVTGSVDAAVEAAPAALTVSPAVATVGKGDSQVFTAMVADQFGIVMAPPPAITWSSTGGGSMAGDGSFSASTVGSFSVTAAVGSVTGNAALTVTGMRLARWTPLHFTPGEITGGLAADESDADGDGFTNLAEYAFGTDPRAATPWPDQGFDGNRRLTLVLSIPTALPDVVYFGEATGTPGPVWETSLPFEIVTPGDPRTIRLTDPVSADASARRFLRLRVARPG